MARAVPSLADPPVPNSKFGQSSNTEVQQAATGMTLAVSRCEDGSACLVVLVEVTVESHRDMLFLGLAW
jgi:hypothetical protein